MKYIEIERKFLVQHDKLPDLSKREYMDIFEVPELFRKEQFLVLVYPVKNEKYGYL